ncbi:MAG: hypothetical protein KC466_16820, partial [Myxococcales bacterium]|nr:hypothetical protein [Myxococcales bacterium]
VDSPYVRRVKLSAPYFEFAKGERSCADCPALAKDLADAIRWDMEFTQLFELAVVDQEEIRATYNATAAGVFRFNRLARLGLDGVLIGRVTPEAGDGYEVVLTLERVDEQRPA